MNENNSRWYYQKYTCGNNFYIHCHRSNIGRMRLGEKETATSLTNIFNEQKEDVIKATFNQYNWLFQQSLSDESLDLLKSITNPDNEKEVLTAINKSIVKSMNRDFDHELSKQLFDLKQEASLLNFKTTDKTLLSIINDEDMKDLFEDIDKILEIMRKGCQLLLGKQGEENYLSLLLSILTIPKSHKEYSQYGRKIQRDLALCANNIYLIENGHQPTAKKTFKGIKVNTVAFTKMKAILNDINTLAVYLTTGRTKPKRGQDVGDPITIKTIQSNLLQNTIPQAFAESSILNVIYMANANVIKAMAKGSRVTGSDKVAFVMSDPEGKYVNIQDYIGTPAYGKADAVLSNYNVSFSTKYDGIQSFDITMDLGVSNKIYASTHVPEANGTYGDDNKGIDAGGGMTVGRAIDMSFKKQRIKYLAYNTLAYNRNFGMNKPFEALKDVLYKRSVVNLFGIRGTTDFAHVLVINGDCMSLWEIIDAVINMPDKIGKRPVRFSIEDKGFEITFRDKPRNIPNNGDRAELRRIVDERANRIGSAIQDSHITAHLKANRLKELARRRNLR